MTSRNDINKYSETEWALILITSNQFFQMKKKLLKDVSLLLWQRKTKTQDSDSDFFKKKKNQNSFIIEETIWLNIRTSFP